MRRTRIQAAVGTIAIAAAVGGSLAVRADGQAGPPSGTLEFDVVADASSDGGTNPSGAKAGKYPRIAEVNAANAKIVIGGKTVGRWDNWQVVTDRGNGRAGGDMRLIVQALVTIGGDTIA
ncbi:MAG: hypothetical protein QOG77_1703, partial [Solirubrobacteraceae bacterium]|nr:hypothetical protein [Solirubrobacteraceae bacterium]